MKLCKNSRIPYKVILQKIPIDRGNVILPSSQKIFLATTEGYGIGQETSYKSTSPSRQPPASVVCSARSAWDGAALSEHSEKGTSVRRSG